MHSNYLVLLTFFRSHPILRFHAVHSSLRHQTLIRLLLAPERTQQLVYTMTPLLPPLHHPRHPFIIPHPRIPLIILPSQCHPTCLARHPPSSPRATVIITLP